MQRILTGILTRVADMDTIVSAVVTIMLTVIGDFSRDMEWLDTLLSPMLEVSCDAPRGGGCLRILAWLQEAVNFVLQIGAKVPVNDLNCPDFLYSPYSGA